MAQVARKSSSAFVDLSRRNSRRIRLRVYRILGNWEDAEDVLEDSLLRASKRLGQFRGTCSFSTWLTRIAINSALTVLRKRRARIEMSYDRTADSFGTVESWEFPHLTPSPEPLCAGREQRCCCKTQCFRLLWCYQTVAEMYHANQCTTDEITRDLVISVAAVKSRMYPGKEGAASIIAEICLVSLRLSRDDGRLAIRLYRLVEKV